MKRVVTAPAALALFAPDPARADGLESEEQLTVDDTDQRPDAVLVHPPAPRAGSTSVTPAGGGGAAGTTAPGASAPGAAPGRELSPPPRRLAAALAPARAREDEARAPRPGHPAAPHAQASGGTAVLRPGRRTLRPGRYRLTLTPLDADRLAGARARLTLRLRR
jgi:hypothetical protein